MHNSMYLNSIQVSIFPGAGMSRRFFIVQWYPRIKSVASNTACYAVSCLNDSILKFGKLLSDGLIAPHLVVAAYI